VILPRQDLPLDFFHAADASEQTLVDHHIQFNFRYVEPTAMLRRVDKFETIPQRLGLVGRKPLVERPRIVCVQVSCPLPV